MGKAGSMAREQLLAEILKTVMCRWSALKYQEISLSQTPRLTMLKPEKGQTERVNRRPSQVAMQLSWCLGKACGGLLKSLPWNQ